jgi:nucleoside-diphosphate-sugar epimerase
MNILITGGSGFFGSKLTQKFLERGDKVTVYDNLSFGEDGHRPFIGNDNYNLVIGDVTDFDKIGDEILKNDIVIHMAALVGEPICKKNKEVSNKME